MVLYKQVNGERVELSAEEEAAARAEWAKNDLERQEEMELHELIKTIPSVEERLDILEICLTHLMDFTEFIPKEDLKKSLEKVIHTRPKIESKKKKIKKAKNVS